MRDKVAIVLIGAPCSGKSSVGKLVAESTGIAYISSGDIARDMAKDDKEISDNLNNGGLAPEQRMRNKIIEHISGHKIFVLDGFPRFRDQKDWIEGKLTDCRFVYIQIYTDNITLRKRSKERGRSDDDSFYRRLEFFVRNTENMMNEHDAFYQVDNTYNIDKCVRNVSIIIENEMTRMYEGYLTIAGMDRYDLINNMRGDKPSFTIWFSGCTHHCVGCHNPELWDSDAGELYGITELYTAIENNRKAYGVDTVVLLGGEPLQQNIQLLEELCKSLDGFNIWLYTGYDIDKAMNIAPNVLKYVSILKCGRYIESMRQDGFPASTNQKVYRHIAGGWKLIDLMKEEE